MFPRVYCVLMLRVIELAIVDGNYLLFLLVNLS